MESAGQRFWDLGLQYKLFKHSLAEILLLQHESTTSFSSPYLPSILNATYIPSRPTPFTWVLINEKLTWPYTSLTLSDKSKQKQTCMRTESNVRRGTFPHGSPLVMVSCNHGYRGYVWKWMSLNSIAALRKYPPYWRERMKTPGTNDLLLSHTIASL